jgi:hypothetical protein
MAIDRRSVLKTVGVLALGLHVGAEASRPAQAENAGANEMTEARRIIMSNVNETVVRYLSVWNEQDATRRRDLVAKTWSEDGTYIDGARQRHRGAPPICPLLLGRGRNRGGAALYQGNRHRNHRG